MSTPHPLKFKLTFVVLHSVLPDSNLKVTYRFLTEDPEVPVVHLLTGSNSLYPAATLSTTVQLHGAAGYTVLDVSPWSYYLGHYYSQNIFD